MREFFGAATPKQSKVGTPSSDTTVSSSSSSSSSSSASLKKSPDLSGDLLLGAFLAHSSDLIYVIEDDVGKIFLVLFL